MDPDDKKVTVVLYGVVAVLVIGIAWLVSDWRQVRPDVVASGQEPKTGNAVLPVPAVSGSESVSSSASGIVRTVGVVKALYETQLVSDVTGVVDWISPELVAGGKFRKGQEMLKVEKLEYQARLARSKADLEQKRLEMVEEKADAINSVSSWVGDKSHKQGSSSELVVRLPHRRALAARVDAMEADVKLAEQALERTTILAPYDCIVASCFVGKGSRLQDGAPVASLFSLDARIVRVSVPIKELGKLGWNSEGNPEARIQAYVQVGGTRYQWDGQVDRIEGRVDPKTADLMLVARMASNESNPVSLRVAPVGLPVRVELIPSGMVRDASGHQPSVKPEGRPAGEPCPPLPASDPPGAAV